MRSQTWILLLAPAAAACASPAPDVIVQTGDTLVTVEVDGCCEDDGCC